MSDKAQRVRCSFYIRTPSAAHPDMWDYTSVDLGTPSHTLDTFHPPQVGDRIALGAPMFEVVARDWMHPQHGSGAWPYRELYPVVGPMMQVIVVPAEGLFVDQAPVDADEE